MYQFRIDFENGKSFTIITILKQGEVYQMVDENCELYQCRFGGSKSGLVATGSPSLVTREVHGASGTRDCEQHIDGASAWDWIAKWMDPQTAIDLDYPVTGVTVTIRDGKPIAPSDPDRSK